MISIGSSALLLFLLVLLLCLKISPAVYINYWAGSYYMIDLGTPHNNYPAFGSWGYCFSCPTCYGYYVVPSSASNSDYGENLDILNHIDKTSTYISGYVAYSTNGPSPWSSVFVYNYYSPYDGICAQFSSDDITSSAYGVQLTIYPICSGGYFFSSY